MNKNQARQLLASIIQELEAGTMFIEDLGQENITELLNLVRPSNKHTESAIKEPRCPHYQACDRSANQLAQPTQRMSITEAKPCLN